MSPSDILAVLTDATGWLEAALIVLVPLELLRWLRSRELDRGRLAEIGTNIVTLLPTVAVAGLTTATAIGAHRAVAGLLPWAVPTTPLTAALALLAVDFLYYWEHRCAHRVPLLWAAYHTVHHSSPRFDQTTGLRISFVDGFVTPLFYLPATALGFAPELVLGCFLCVIAYQTWIHTELIGRLPWLDGWLNTPANHRVHHACQPHYHDRNFGAVLMLWDRLFGTYAPEQEAPRFGTSPPLGSSNPIAVHFSALQQLWRLAMAQPGLRRRLAVLLSPSTPAPTAIEN
jgi:sterol desaturase/sphingolipid hydroxylase (fatty acid hydroxylase superfamily)